MNHNRKVAFYTLGCKLNFSESSTIGRMMMDEGYAKVEFDDSPDVFVINTCSVTENADKKCKQLVKRAMKINPKGFVAIIGCYAQLKPQEISEIPGVDVVLGANEKFNIVEHLDDLEKKEIARIENENIKETKEFVPAYSYGDRTRSFLKVQDGCDYFCTFCTIPLARGKSRNASVADTIKKAEEIGNTEIKEVVLTGVNIGDFGQGGDENFYQLVQALDKVNGVERYRISSIEPNLLSNEIIEYCLNNSEKFVPHFHIPLQSGNDRLLEAMRRKYDRALFAERIKKINEINPMTCIGVDVIVGFPGETDEEFMDTVNFLKDLEISYLHVFTYSERAKTTAVKLGDAVPMNIRKQRSRQLHILSEKKKRAFYEKNIGETGIALLEGDDHDGFMHGFTENYIKVKVPYDESLTNTFVRVKHQDIDSEGVMNISVLEEVPTV
ncbi:MAG: tRNA (N(6)-L-threonylcarbamoyladenosine(37)-C(2))-methylthiotransferase MtaB [Crocinitomicaceae bacterium]